MWLKIAETKLKLEQALSTPRSKVIAFTRDISAAAGDVAYTGIGFTPTSIIFTSTLDVKEITWGRSDSAKNGQGNYLFATTWATGALSVYGTNVIIAADLTGGNYHFAIVKTYDTDGFTLTWTKINSPTGTINVTALCFR